MHFLITAGGTREYIDPVRFISNASSGRMGYALAGAALEAGHKVTLITTVEISKLKTQRSKLLKLVRVETAAQMFDAVKKHFPRCDCLIMAAAVSDYTPARPARTKIKRTGKPIALRLKPTRDILKWAGTHKKKSQIVVGFALEDKNLRERAQQKLEDKKLDMIVANTPASIGRAAARVQIGIRGGDWLRFLQARKAVIARRIVSLIKRLRPISDNRRQSFRPV